MDWGQSWTSAYRIQRTTGFDVRPSGFRTALTTWVHGYLTLAVSALGKQGISGMRYTGIPITLLLLLILMLPVMLVWIIPPLLAPIFDKEPPARILRLGALIGALVLSLSCLGLFLVALLLRP